MVESRESVDVAVVGGGLGGLTTATLLARVGLRVVLFEKASSFGGRAATQSRHGHAWNLGPHALYRGGRAWKALAALGVTPHGGIPSSSGNHALYRGKKHILPGGFLSLVSTGLLTLAAKIEVGRVLSSLSRIDPDPLASTTVAAWIDSVARQPDARALLQALARVSTYANAVDIQSAGAAVAQLRMAIEHNVLYIDDGWMTLVSDVRAAAMAAGVQLVASARVVSVEACSSAAPGKSWRVRLDGRSALETRAVVLAGSPAMARALCPDVSSLRAYESTATPIHAACLDVALGSLPHPSSRFLLGIDRPYYASVHSAYARLAPEGGATIHLAKYLAPGATSGGGDEAELLEVLDLLQPGWRDVVTDRRFLPSMIVSHAIVTAAQGGLAGRPPSAVPDAPGIHLVGDWVGPEGMLLDASLASAENAASTLARELRTALRRNPPSMSLGMV